MIKITIDENILKLTPRSKKFGKRLLWFSLSVQVITVMLICGAIAFFVWAASFDSFAERKAEYLAKTSSTLVHQVPNKIE